MPFNDKGEFIRTSGSAPPSTRRVAHHRPSADPDGLSRDDLLTLAKGFGAIVLLAGLIWLAVVFHKWVAFALGWWVISSLRNWMR